MEDIYGSKLYNQLNEEFVKEGKVPTRERLDAILEFYDDPDLAIVLNKFESIYPTEVSQVNTSLISGAVAEHGEQR